MVVNKKQSIPVAPPMGSRTNSTQPLPRQKSTSNSKPLTAGPSTSPLKKMKPKKQSKAVKSTKSSTFVDRLILILLGTFSIYALWTCPSDTSLSNPLCRSLSQYRTHVLEPYVLPPIQKALSHPSVAPAITKLHDAERAVTPAVLRVHAASQPYITKATSITRAVALTVQERAVLPIYNNYVHPSYRKYLLPQYRRYLAPRIQLVRSRVIDPYVAPVTLKAHFYANRIIYTLQQTYHTVSPRVQAVYARVRPFIERAWVAIKPYAVKAGEVSATSFAFAVEKGAEARRQYVDPHVLRIWEKVVELSGSTATRSTTATMPAASATSAEDIPETKAASLEVEPETTQSSSPSLAPVSTSSSEAVVPEPSSETASASIPEEASLPVETPATPAVVEEATLSSVASVIEARISGAASAEPSLVTELSSSASSAAASDSDEKSEVIPTLTESAVIADSTSEPEVEADPEPDSSLPEEPVSPPQDDLDDFFADLGIADLDDEAEIDVDEPVAEEPVKSMSPQEAADARKAANAKKRADLEARMQKWHLDLEALVKRRTKEFRKELVRVRKGAVRSLFPDPEKGDDSDLEESLTHIRGEDIAGILGRYEKDCEKLLKGLESYLKKEEKAGVDSTTDVEDRMKRWRNVVQRVEDRFAERLNELQEKVHWWYLEVRELEVQEYHRATKEVKLLAEKAQGDMGLPMAWLDDVTYQDWQKYHDLIRAHERFDEQIRLIQNGTHPHPPIDPLPPALDKLQLDLENISNGFKIRVRDYSVRMRELLAPPPPDAPVEAASQPPSDAGDASSEEEQVSILPIDPIPTSPAEEEFDASQVVIGKSKEQVEEAMGIAKEYAHEEL